MSAAEAASDPKPSRASGLLGLVRQLIDYGRQLAATLRSNPHPFGASDIALILARITRGLLRAEALEARIIRTAARLDADPAPPRASHRQAPPARAAAARPTDSARPLSPPQDLIRGSTRGSACPRPSRSPPRSAVARSAPSSPTSAAISASCRTIRYGANCSMPSSAMTATWPIWWRTSSIGRFSVPLPPGPSPHFPRRPCNPRRLPAPARPDGVHPKQDHARGRSTVGPAVPIPTRTTDKQIRVYLRSSAV